MITIPGPSTLDVCGSRVLLATGVNDTYLQWDIGKSVTEMPIIPPPLLPDRQGAIKAISIIMPDPARPAHVFVVHCDSSYKHTKPAGQYERCLITEYLDGVATNRYTKELLANIRWVRLQCVYHADSACTIVRLPCTRKVAGDLVWLTFDTRRRTFGEQSDPLLTPSSSAFSRPTHLRFSSHSMRLHEPDIDNWLVRAESYIVEARSHGYLVWSFDAFPMTDMFLRRRYTRADLDKATYSLSSLISSAHRPGDLALRQGIATGLWSSIDEAARDIERLVTDNQHI